MREVLTTLSELVGIVAVVVGLFLVAPAVGFIGGGAVLLAAGSLLARPVTQATTITRGDK